MPQAGRGETTTRLKMEIKAGRMNVLAAVGKPHRDVRLVGTLVVRETSVTVDAKQGSVRSGGSATR
jgi:hypothetical protein